MKSAKSTTKKICDRIPLVSTSIIIAKELACHADKKGINDNIFIIKSMDGGI